jgi:hypothetical protein
VKTTRAGGESRGVDGGKKVMGRKRLIITDTVGLLLTAEIHAANEYDGKAGFRIIKSLYGRFERERKSFMPTEVIRVSWKKKSKKTSDGVWKSLCGQTNQPDLSPCPNDGWKKEPVHGWKISAGWPKITNIWFLQAWL